MINARINALAGLAALVSLSAIGKTQTHPSKPLRIVREFGAKSE